MPKGHPITFSTTQIQMIVRLYAEEGWTASRIAQRDDINCDDGVIIRLLRHHDCLRDPSERALLQRNTIIAKISKDRLRKDYWASDRPSMRELGKRYGVSGWTVGLWIEKHGIKKRTCSEQWHCDVKTDRRSVQAPPQPSPEVRRELGRKGASVSRLWIHCTAETRKKQAEARRSGSFCPCVWCGAPRYVHLCDQKIGQGKFCSHSHAATYHAYLNRHGIDAPRPVILQRLRQLFDQRLPHGTPITLERLEKIGEEIGAGESEYLTLILGDEDAVARDYEALLDRRKKDLETKGLKGPRRQFSEVDLQQILQRYSEGEIYKEIALNLGVSISAIGCIVRDAGIQRSRGAMNKLKPPPPCKLSERDQRDVAELFYAGERACELAKAYDISEHTVRAYIKKFGPPIKDQKAA